MPLYGQVGGAVGDQLLQMLEQQVREQLAREQLAQQARQFNERITLDRDQFAAGERERESDRALRTRALDQQDQSRRDAVNRVGVADMMAQREVMDADEKRRRVEGLVSRVPQGAPQLAAGLRAEGINMPTEDVENPQERQTREAAELKRIGTIAAIQRGPDRLNRLEHQDETGATVTSFLPDSQVAGRTFKAPAPNTGAANRQKALDEVTLLEKQLTDILNFGRTNRWTGVGGMKQGTMGRVAKQQFGKGSDQGEMLRNMIGNLRTDIAHEKFGSAFTGNERAMLNTFAPDIDRDPSAIETNIQALLQQARRKRAQLSGQSAQGGSSLEPMRPVSSHGRGEAAAPPTEAVIEYVRDPATGRLVRKQ